MNKPKAVFDLHRVSEDDRITMIADSIMGMGSTGLVGVLVDDVPGKPERYIEKLTTRFPLIELVDRGPGPVEKVVLLRFRQKPQ